ncbi:MAG: DUF47 family protein [Candidatus Ranarchaeia archaeon]
MKKVKVHEDAIKQGLISLAQIILAASESLKRLYAGDKDELERILGYEAQGDILVDKIDKAIEEIKISPTLQIDRSRLVHRLDDVLDAQERLARNFRIYYEVLEASSYELLRELAEINIEASKLLLQALETFFTSFDKALDLVKQITKTRDRTRFRVYQMREAKFKSASDWKEYYALDTLVKRHRDILEEIKDASAVINHIAIKYTA